MGEQALIVIDVQNDFCLPDAVLCVKGAMRCIPNVVAAVDAARSHGVPVVWVVREHDPSGEPKPGGRLWPCEVLGDRQLAPC